MTSRVSDTERAAMRRALALGDGARGRTSPNPPVGAVILAADGTTVGEGATAPAGGPHAEVAALARAGGRARGGTAVADPNPAASGGAGLLRDAGVTVIAGVDAAAAEAGAMRAWLHAMRTARPFVTWKYAATLDGRVAAADQSARWISSSPSRADAHRLRAVVDAIVVGSGTILADDPSLTARDAEGGPLAHQPLRVVLDRRHRVRQCARVLDNAAETLMLDTAVPRFALKALFDRGVRHVLLEGGPTLAGAFIEARCVDEVVAYLAPMLLGEGPSALGHAGITSIAQAVTLETTTVSRLGDDIKLVAVPRWAEPNATDG